MYEYDLPLKEDMKLLYLQLYYTCIANMQLQPLPHKDLKLSVTKPSPNGKINAKESECTVQMRDSTHNSLVKFNTDFQQLSPRLGETGTQRAPNYDNYRCYIFMLF